MPVVREGELSGLAAMIADLIEGNLQSNPERSKLLRGRPKKVKITASDLDAEVGLIIGEDNVVVHNGLVSKAHIWIYTDSETLIDLPRAGLLGGLPSIADPVGREMTKRMLTGRLKVKGVYRLGLLTRVQRLLSVS